MAGMELEASDVSRACNNRRLLRHTMSMWQANAARHLAPPASQVVNKFCRRTPEQQRRDVEPTPSNSLPPFDWESPVDEIAKDRSRQAVLDLLPLPYRIHLSRMPEEKRVLRIAAIEERFPVRVLRWLNLHPAELKKVARGMAREAAADMNCRGPLSAEQKRRRQPRFWLRRISKEVREADRYIAATVGAVGGPERPGRALYVSDYSLARHKAEQGELQQVQERLRLVRADNATVQIPLAWLEESRVRSQAAERRAIIDAFIHRGKTQSLYLCWITLTLPGEWHPHTENEPFRMKGWDVSLGPAEADAEMRLRYKRVVNLARKRGIRPTGFWVPQPQQDGTVHRHLAYWVHDLKQARGLCDAVRMHFPGEKEAAAYVVGDDNPRYRPPHRKDVAVPETVVSVVRYMSRQAINGVIEEGAAAERVRAWRKLGGHHSMTFVGLRRGAFSAWRTLIAAARRGEAGTSPRTHLAIRKMREMFRWSRRAERLRGAGDREVAEVASRQASRAGYEAALAAGLWPDRDLTENEVSWLQRMCGAEAEPETVHEQRRNSYDELSRKFIGLRAAVGGKTIRRTQHQWSVLEVTKAFVKAKGKFARKLGQGTKGAEIAFAVWKSPIKNWKPEHFQLVALSRTYPRKVPSLLLRARACPAPRSRDGPT